MCCELDQPQEADIYMGNKEYLSPEQRYGQLFVDVQMAKIFPDGKTFVDAIPKYSTEEIMKEYNARKKNSEIKLDLKAFVEEFFDRPKNYASGFKSDTSRSVTMHINELWPVLTRKPEDKTPGTLIPLPYPYIVPGGRFGEIYYWDSYFTMLGLQVSGQVDMIENMVNNFSFLIDEIGFIPNGNRTYFLSRSQPPFYALMVGILAAEKGDEIYAKYLPQLEKEYNFWMAGLQQLSAKNPAHKHVVRLKDGSTLNRYWDAGDTPRAEMYRDDVETAERSGRPIKKVYSDLRAACESGWDFSSRWLHNTQQLSTIHTTEIIPVDLNALLYKLEKTLEQAYSVGGDIENADLYNQRATQRLEAVIQYCWDSTLGYFQDYDFARDTFTGTLSLAGMYPLFFEMAEPAQAEASAGVIQRDFLQPGGVVTTLDFTGQQWDAPNGWAPLQWVSVKGLKNYGHKDLADTIARRWIELNDKVYHNTGKMVEKYNVMDMSLDAGGGEYPVQDGFGWTNGVYLRLMEEINDENTTE
ncbi:MAG: cytoplasmic trehalase [Saprospiraceae bacterium]|nr:MAG: cytoplasmic trehalase [Saprospiraceae bacterium]